MKKLAVLGAVATLMLSPIASAADVKVKWHEPENYQDIYEGNTQSKTKFRKRLFNTIEAKFEEKAKELPKGYSLEITMLDVDLAGEVQRGMQAQIRKISDHDFPRLHFYMVLRDRNDKIVFQGEQNLRERKDKHKAFRMRGSQSEFYLETMLVEKFFEKALKPALNKV